MFFFSVWLAIRCLKIGTFVLIKVSLTYLLITELEVRRALDGLSPHKGAGPDWLFPKVPKALLRMFNLSLQTTHVPED